MFKVKRQRDFNLTALLQYSYLFLNAFMDCYIYHMSEQSPNIFITECIYIHRFFI